MTKVASEILSEELPAASPLPVSDSFTQKQLSDLTSEICKINGISTETEVTKFQETESNNFRLAVSKQ